MNEVKWNDLQLRVAYEDGCKYQNFDDLVEHLQSMDELSDAWQTNEKTTSESVLPIPCVVGMCCENPHEKMRRTGEDMFVCKTCGKEYEI